ncbi:MAG: metallophosphoesterase [Nanopusillaceae archaeon]
MMKFIKNYACVFLKEISSLVIGDLHIGYEFELKNQGINVAYTEKIKEDIEVCRNKTKAKNIILLGDTKHSIGLPTNKKEIEKLKDFFDFLKEKFEKIYVVKGNHDGLIEKIIKDEKINIYSSRGFSLLKYGFFHGNSYPISNVLKSKIIFCSHAHSKYLLPKDKKIYELRIFSIFGLKKEFGKNKKLIIIPPFSPLLAGKEIEEVIKSSNIIKKLVDIENIEIYSLDGIKLE